MTAFEVLIKNLGPDKTNQLWQMLVPSQGEYKKWRSKVFRGKTVRELYVEAKKFNRDGEKA